MRDTMLLALLMVALIVSQRFVDSSEDTSTVHPLWQSILSASAYYRR